MLWFVVLELSPPIVALVSCHVANESLCPHRPHLEFPLPHTHTNTHTHTTCYRLAELASFIGVCYAAGSFPGPVSEAPKVRMNNRHK